MRPRWTPPAIVVAAFAALAIGCGGGASLVGNEDASVVISFDAWKATEDPKATFDQCGAPVFAVDVTPDKAWTSIAVAGTRPDGRPYVELVEHARGTAWAPGRLADIQRTWRARILADLAGPAGALEAACRTVGVELEAVSAREHAQACGFIHDAAVEGRLVHRPDTLLDASLIGAVKRDVGDGAWVWSRKNSQVVISPLVAATIAVGAVASDVLVPAGFKSLDDYLDEE